jgi:hypothetical protein
MKSIILIGTYLVSFVLFFLLLSLIGVIFTPYRDIVTNHNWFMVYALSALRRCNAVKGRLFLSAINSFA